MVSMATRNVILENGSVASNPIISQQILTLDYNTWYQIEVQTQAFYSKVRYAKYLICIFMNINEIHKVRENRKAP